MIDRNNFFDRLLLLPLFQGIGRSEFFEISERIRIGFQRIAAGEVFIRQDLTCDRLYFVLDGKMQASYRSDTKNYVLYEHLDQPMVLQAENLFGLRTRFTHTFQATTHLHVLKIEKTAVRDILFHYPTFRINYLNLVSTQAQHFGRTLRKHTPADLETRFVAYLSARCLRPAGHKTLNIKMTRLAEELLATRLRVSHMLNALEDRQLVRLHRGRIEIPRFESLIMK